MIPELDASKHVLMSSTKSGIPHSSVQVTNASVDREISADPVSRIVYDNET